MEYSGNLPSFTLNKKDLEELEQILKRDAPENSHIKLRIAFSGFTIEKDNVLDLINEPGLPDKVSQMKISLSQEASFIPEEGLKTGSITTGGVFSTASLHLSGDSNWVRSKKEAITQFFNLKKNRNEIILIISIILFLMAFSFLFSAIITPNFSTVVELRIKLFMSIFFILSVLNFLRLDKDYPLSSIELREVKSSKWGTVLTLSIIGTIIGGIILAAMGLY